MTITLAQVDSWRAEARTLSPPDSRDRKVGKSEAVALMAAELRGLARRGYSVDQLVAWLATKGLIVHRDTLRRALRKGRATRATTAGISDRSAADDKRDRFEAAKPITRKPRPRSSDDGPRGLDRTSAATPRETFFPRPDSEEL